MSFSPGPPSRSPKTSRAGTPAARARATNTELTSAHLPLRDASVASTSPKPQPGTSGSRRVFSTVQS